MGNSIERKSIKILIITYLFGIVIYSLLISQRLTNTYDGLWISTFSRIGPWAVSSGRFIWPYLNYIGGHVCDDPWMALVSLFIFSAAMVLADLIIGFKKWYHSLTFNLMFISNVVVCVFLSYRFQSPVFALSIFFSILPVFLIQKIRNWVGIVLSGVSIMLTMGTYQANIGCSCVMVLLYIAIIACNGMEHRAIGRELLRVVGAFIIGALLYIIFLKLHLMIFNVGMSSYRGANTYSIANTIMKLPSSIIRAYTQFIDYFYKNQFLITVYQRFKSFIIIQAIIIVLLIIIIIGALKKDCRRTLILVAAIALMPLAANAVLFVATDTETSIQMTAPSAMVLPSIFAIMINALSSDFCGLSKSINRTVGISLLLVGFIFAYTEALQVCIDQSEMLMSTRATTWMYNESIDDIKDEGLLDANLSYCYIGKPSGNSLFLQNDLARWSNQYTRIGDFWLEGECATLSYKGVKSNLGGVGIAMIEPEDYEIIRNNEEIRDMSIFPEDGYIKLIDGIVVVKLSEDGY